HHGERAGKGRELGRRQVDADVEVSQMRRSGKGNRVPHAVRQLTLDPVVHEEAGVVSVLLEQEESADAPSTLQREGREVMKLDLARVVIGEELTVGPGNVEGDGVTPRLQRTARVPEHRELMREIAVDDIAPADEATRRLKIRVET